MRTRDRMLPVGWYPPASAPARRRLKHLSLGRRRLPPGTTVYGGIVPHAGWHFSGKAAARVFFLAAKARQPQVVCVFGGHLGANSPPLLVADDAWETPGQPHPGHGILSAPGQTADLSGRKYPGDNTTRCSCLWVKYFFPQAKLLALRAPHSNTAIELGQAVAAVAQELKLSLLSSVHRPDPLRP